MNNQSFEHLKKLIDQADDNLEKQLVYINKCILNINNMGMIDKQYYQNHLIQLMNTRLKLTLRYIAKYNTYPDINKQFNKHFNN